MGSLQEPQSFACHATSHLPSSILEFLKKSSASNPSHLTVIESKCNKPPSKRKRTSAPVVESPTKPIQYIVLRRTTINISFPNSATSQESNVHYQNAEPIYIEISRKDSQTFDIRIDSISGSGRVAASTLFQIEVAATELPLQDVELAMLKDKKFLPGDGQGRLWTETFLSLHRRDNDDHLAITMTLKWETTQSLLYVGKWEKRAMLHQCLHKYYPNLVNGENQEDLRTPQAFYSCAHTPKKDDLVASSLVVPDVQAELYPFQKRSVLWLLGREGMKWSPEGLTALEEGEAPDSGQLPPSFVEVVDDQGTPFFINSEMMIATTDITPFKNSQSGRLRGGILAEEMGLGKTLEILSLITLHKLDIPTEIGLADDILPIKATLLVVPSSLMSQWVSEIRHHSPSLTVYQYYGINVKAWDKSFKSFEDTRREFSQHDVVITTYDVLSAEIFFTIPPPDRKLRTRTQKRERTKSPLPVCLWWRICIDEAQMITGGLSSAAKVSQKLPRINSWGISGTPVRGGVADLHGLLVFLKCEPYSSNQNLWSRLLHSPRHFATLIRTLTLRHSKQAVRDELQLPPQKRFVITMPFTQIEEQHYSSLFQAMANDCGMDKNGSPLADDWVPNYGKMRAWLSRLRQTALHPEVGGHNRRALGRSSGSLRTLDQIVLVMLEQMDGSIRTNEREILISKLKRGQVLAKDSKTEAALGIWNSVQGEISTISNDIRKQIDLEVQSTDSQIQKESADSDSEGKGIGEESSKIWTLRNHLRTALNIEHMAVFFAADGYFQMKSMAEPDSLEFMRLEEKEVEGYGQAKVLRHEILREIINKATRLMGKISKKAFDHELMSIPTISLNIHQGSTDNQKALNKLSTCLDLQGNQILKWRDETVKLLTKPLVDDDEEVEITGNEYEESTKTQDLIMVLVMALRTLISDRRELLGGGQNMFTHNEVKNALNLAKGGGGAYPEKTIEVLNIREKLKAGPDVKSLRAVVSEARSLASRLRLAAQNGSTRHDAELRTVEAELQTAHKLLTEQEKIIQSLDFDLELFTSTMNTRLEYYRQLQQVSDTLRDPDGLHPEVVANMINEERHLRTKIAASKMKKRYFEHLQSLATSDQSWTCVICQESFEGGVFTICGHAYCKPDFTEWWKTHKNCPTCKNRLGPMDIHDISCKSQVLVGREDSATVDDERGSTKSPKKSPIYQSISKETLAQIQDIKLGGNSNFTTKVDTLAKHIIWLRKTDPGVKSIVYCQYRDFLHVLSQAFTKYGIGYDTIEKTKGAERFKTDPSKEVFLLHARAHASGLNLVNASHVFLCEPLLQTALELQAIARVDRIGQNEATTVWLYLIDGTVEQSIYNISVTRRLEHMGKTNKGKSREGSLDPDLLERNIEQANSMELQEGLSSSLVKKRDGGEFVPDDELWQCLFGNAHVQGTIEDVQF